MQRQAMFGTYGGRGRDRPRWSPKEFHPRSARNEEEKSMDTDAGKGEFPYNDTFLGNSSILPMLLRLKRSKPSIIEDRWEIPREKVKTRMADFKEIYHEYIDYSILNKTAGKKSFIILLSTLDSQNRDRTEAKVNTWEVADVVVDLYNEKARINTPGYGEKYPMLDYWHSKELHSRWIHELSGDKSGRKLKEYRDAIYNSVQDARPAYISICINLYHALINFRETYDMVVKRPEGIDISRRGLDILDISAYGERAIAAAMLPGVRSYDGVDPNENLIDGYSKIKADLRMISDVNVNFWSVPLEDFKCNESSYDIVTLSPPPHTMEKYSGSADRQSYSRYPTFMEWLCSFVTGMIEKAHYALRAGGILSITMLDRDESKFRPKQSKGASRVERDYISPDLSIAYVEATLLIASCFGFKYIGSLGLSRHTPWWTFIKLETADPIAVNSYERVDCSDYASCVSLAISRLYDNYPELFEKFGIKRRLSNSIAKGMYMTRIVPFPLTPAPKIMLHREISGEESKLCSLINDILTDPENEHNGLISALSEETQERIDKLVSSKNAYDSDPEEIAISLEVFRGIIHNAMIDQIFQYVSPYGLKRENLATMLGRWLMTNAIHTSFEIPWSIGTEPLFPAVICSTGTIVDNMIYSGVPEKEAKFIIFDQIYSVGPYYAKGIADAYSKCCMIMSDLSTRKTAMLEFNAVASVDAEKMNALSGHSGHQRDHDDDNCSFVINVNSDLQKWSPGLRDLVRLIPRGAMEYGFYNPFIVSKIIGVSQMPGNSKLDIISACQVAMRLDAVGAKAHHFTRPMDRSRVLLKAFKESPAGNIIDIFASYMNSRSIVDFARQAYCSAYPDVERPFGSLGSAFNIKLRSGSFIANIISTPMVVVPAVMSIVNDIDDATRSICVSLGFTVFKDEADIGSMFPEAGSVSKKNSAGLRSFLLSSPNLPLGLRISLESKFVKFVYVLDAERYPTVDPSIRQKDDGHKHSHRGTYSVGVLLTKNKDIDVDAAAELGLYDVVN